MTPTIAASNLVRLIGTWPSPGNDPIRFDVDPAEYLAAATQIAGRVGDYLVTPPVIEIGRRYVSHAGMRLQSNPPHGIQVVRRGDYSNMFKRPLFDLSDGYPMPDLSSYIHLIEYTSEFWPIFSAMQLNGQFRSDSKLQVGIPSPDTIGFLLFNRRYFQSEDIMNGVAATMRYQMETIYSMLGGQVVFQIELPFETMMTAVHLTKRRSTAQKYADRLAAFISSLSFDPLLNAHLCFGALNDKAAVKGTLKPLVALANAISERLSFYEVHMPIGDASRPAPLHRSRFYGPLAELDLKAGRLAAGFVHRKLTHEQMVQILWQVQRHFGAPVTISTPCGLRLPEDKAIAQLDHMALLAQGR